MNLLLQFYLKPLEKIRIIAKRLLDKLKKFNFWLTSIKQHSKIFFNNNIWPILLWWIIATSLFIFAVIIFSLTKVGLETDLSDKYQELFNVLTSTTGVIIAIFFSLILLPLNQIAVKYSPKFLKYLKKDQFFISVFLFSIFTLVYDIVFLFLGQHN